MLIEQQITKNYSEDLLTELINYQGHSLRGEIVRLGIQQLIELDWDDHIRHRVMSMGKDVATSVNEC